MTTRPTLRHATLPLPLLLAAAATLAAPALAHDAGPPAAGMARHAAMGSAMQPGQVRLGYSPEQRDAWLGECRANHAPPRETRRGGLIGGLLGAAAGGFAGNRIADGARLGGTLLGAGLGGLAGAAVGTVIDRADERRDLRRQDAAMDYCEDYLRRYETGVYSQGTYGYPAAAMMAPVMMVPVATQQGHVHGADCQDIEEWDEVVAPVRYVRPRAHRPAPAPRRGKLVPISAGKLVPAQ